jgi:hypothetical protein
VNAKRALSFVRQHGVVLVSAKGPVPRLVDAIAGEPIRGSWWAHPKSRQIYRVLAQIADSKEVLICRLVDGKVTFVHRRLWPALVRAAEHFPAERLALVREEHTSAGYHVTHEIPYPSWVPAEVHAEAARLSEVDAIRQLGAWAAGTK